MTMEMSSTPPVPSSEAIASVTALADKMVAKAKPLVDMFETRYDAWKQTWDKPNEHGEEFVKLTSLGVKILPLVVHKLCSESEGKAVGLYNTIEKNDKFKSESPTAIIECNYQRNKDFDELSAGWETYKANCWSNTSTVYLACGEYMDLVDLGKSIIPHAMLAYYDDFGGWWDQLLCELTSGHLYGGLVFMRQDIYRRWIEWFESDKSEAQAPYKLVGEAARVERFMRERGSGCPDAELEDE